MKVRVFESILRNSSKWCNLLQTNPFCVFPSFIDHLEIMTEFVPFSQCVLSAAVYTGVGMKQWNQLLILFKFSSFLLCLNNEKFKVLFINLISAAVNHLSSAFFNVSLTCARTGRYTFWLWYATGLQTLLMSP